MPNPFHLTGYDESLYPVEWIGFAIHFEQCQFSARTIEASHTGDYASKLPSIIDDIEAESRKMYLRKRCWLRCLVLLDMPSCGHGGFGFGVAAGYAYGFTASPAEVMSRRLLRDTRPKNPTFANGFTASLWLSG